MVQLLAAFTQRFPQESLGWFNLAAFYATAGDCERAMTYLAQALVLDPAGGLRPSLAQDSRFDACRSHQKYKELVGAVPSSNPVTYP